ncbi:MAG: hypothetical protein IGS54_15610 [Elainella sp. C42_A2020_010]|nr:hypothetical protein [Elainella sp. C42_A2020_010]
MQIEKSLAPIKPLLDTWGGLDGDKISWHPEQYVDFTSLSTSEVNSWYSDTVTRTLESFSNFVRVWEVSFGTDYSRENEAKPMLLKWEIGTSYEDYIKKIIGEIQSYSAPIYSLGMKVDLFVYVRTSESPSHPIQGWIRHFGEFKIWGGPEVGQEPGIFFEIGATLFHRSYFRYGDNSELYSLNSHLLTDALHQWERHFGSLCREGG